MNQDRSDVFPKPLLIEALSKWAMFNRQLGTLKQYYLLQQDFIFNSPTFGKLVAPAHLLTDFASIPQAALSVIRSDAPYLLYPAIIHDFLYSVGGMTADRVFTRQQADQLLAEGMEILGASPWQRAVVYSAVRLGGSGSWGGTEIKHKQAWALCRAQARL